MAPASPVNSSMPPKLKIVLKTKALWYQHAEKLSQQAEEHERLINKVTYCLGVGAFGSFCFLLGSRPQDIPYLYCFFFLIVAPLRWIYYRIKKWHYYLLDFCYYANAIFMIMLLFFPNNDKLFLLCFSVSEGPLAWALIVWRCSLVFSSLDKVVSVLIHLLPGTVFFIIRWWDPITFSHHPRELAGPWPAWPYLGHSEALWTWLVFVPLVVYGMWQMLYIIIVHGLRRQRLLDDPDLMTSFRELSRKAAKANNVWWKLSGLLGDGNRGIMYALLQALFTVATLALTVPMFQSYRFHMLFECFKVTACIWNGGSFIFEVMPRQVAARKKKQETSSLCDIQDLSTVLRAEEIPGCEDVKNSAGVCAALGQRTRRITLSDIDISMLLPKLRVGKGSGCGASFDAQQRIKRFRLPANTPVRAN